MNKKLSHEQLAELVTEIFKVRDSVEVTVHGSSMRPTVKDGGRVRFTKAGKLKKYDVALYRRRDGSTVLHRVIGIEKGGYIMRGDAQWQREYGVADSDIIAAAAALITEKGERPLGRGADARRAAFISAAADIRRLLHLSYRKIKNIKK